MDLVERFINYTKFDTQSSEESTSVPSTAKQLEFAKYLKKELEDEGLSDVEMDDIIEVIERMQPLVRVFNGCFNTEFCRCFYMTFPDIK